MAMQCELCGREGQGFRPAEVDGVEMMLCQNCMIHGKGIERSRSSTAGSRTSIIGRIKKPKVKDVYKNMDKELVSNWNDVIKNARKARGLSREELGFKIGHSHEYVAKIENGKQRGSYNVLVKIARALELPPELILAKAGLNTINLMSLGDMKMDLETQQFSKLSPKVKKLLLELSPKIREHLGESKKED